MAYTKTQRTYQFSEFVEATVVSEIVFEQELQDDAGVVEKPTSVYKSGTTVVVDWTDITVSQSTFDAVDAAVVVHTGGAFAELPLVETDETESIDDSGNEQTKVTLNSGLLPAGEYLLGWYCEIRTAATVANTGVQARIYAGFNGATPVERGTDTWDRPAYSTFSGTFPVKVAAGSSWVLRLAFVRIGASSNPGYVRRARLYITKVE